MNIFSVVLILLLPELIFYHHHKKQLGKCLVLAKNIVRSQEEESNPPGKGLISDQIFLVKLNDFVCTSFFR